MHGVISLPDATSCDKSIFTITDNGIHIVASLYSNDGIHHFMYDITLISLSADFKH